MVFDPCPEQKTQIVVKAGILRRRELGLPEEKNITTLYNEMAPLLGIVVASKSSRTVNHLPSPAEMKDEKGEFIIPRKDCPKCGGSMTMPLGPICPSCKDSEGGIYRSGYKCEVKTCEYVDDKNEEFFTQRLSRMGVEIPTGPKQAMGIKTITDDGLK
jgi:hypothetical protein